MRVLPDSFDNLILHYLIIRKKESQKIVITILMIDVIIQTMLINKNVCILFVYCNVLYERR